MIHLCLCAEGVLQGSTKETGLSTASRLPVKGAQLGVGHQSALRTIVSVAGNPTPLRGRFLPGVGVAQVSWLAAVERHKPWGWDPEVRSHMRPSQSAVAGPGEGLLWGGGLCPGRTARSRHAAAHGLRVVAFQEALPAEGERRVRHRQAGFAAKLDVGTVLSTSAR